MTLSYSAIAFFVEWGIRLVMLGWIISRPQRPIVALAWLAFIMFLPWFGLLVYLLIGDHRLGKRRARRYAQDVRLHNVAHRKGGHRAFVTRPQIDEHQRALVEVAETFVGMPILGGNQVE